MTALGRTPIAKVATSVMMLLVLCLSIPFDAFADTMLVDLKANGQDTLTLATSTDSFTVNLTTTGATACQMTSPVASGVSTNMSSTINPGETDYPAVGGSTTFTVTCTDGVTNQSDTVIVSLPAASTPSTPAATSTPAIVPTVDIKANGSDGPVTLTSGQTFTYSWTSSNATACQMTSPVSSGISLSGTSSTVSAGQADYPAAGGSTTFTVVCTDGTTNATDSVVVSLGSAPTGGSSVPTVDIKANGSDGPVTLTSGQTFTYSWTSSNATACQMTSPVSSGISLSGTSSTVAPGQADYPAAGGSTTFTVVCTDGVTNATDSVVVSLGSNGGGGSSNPTVDIKANGSDGPLTIVNGTPFTYTWTSSNATACQMTSPVSSGISLSGTSSQVTPGQADYPAVGGSVTFTVVCTNGTTNATDSVVVSVTNGGGGGSSSGGNYGTQLPPLNEGAACLYVRDYMRADFQNDPVEVIKLQAFLKVFEGYDYVTINGVYDQATVQAVNAFQVKYRGDILDPWGLKGPTSYTYILTLKKVNELYCLHTFPLNEAQQQEIVAFKALVTGLRAQGINPELPASLGGSRTISVPVTHTEIINGSVSTSTATSTISLPIVGTATSTDKGQNTSKLAAVLFAAPKDMMSGLQCVYEFLLILIVLYILGNVLEDVLYKKEDLAKARARFYSKWTTIALGLIVAMIVAYYVNEWCLVLPLLIALILSLAWMSLYKKHLGTWKTTKTWIMPGKTVTTVETKA